MPGQFGGLFGPDDIEQAPRAAGWLGGEPPEGKTPAIPHDDAADPLITWARMTKAALKREKQSVTEEQRTAINLYRGGTPWWRSRPKWKIGTRINDCWRVPTTWAAILTDTAPTVVYSAYNPQQQKIADILTASFTQSYKGGGWRQVIHDTVLNSRIMKKSFLCLRPDPFSKVKNRAKLSTASGSQVYLNRGAMNVDEAEILLYEYRESFSSLIARFPKIKSKLAKRSNEKREVDGHEFGELLQPAATLAMPTGATIYNPPYSASPNPPDGDGSTGGISVCEYWTRPRKTIRVKECQFTVAGEPAVEPKEITYTDGTTEPLSRITTEGNVVYELPRSVVAILYDAAAHGGLQILNEQPAYDCIDHWVEYPLYPDGRLMVVVDDYIKADDRMNPLGYFPFVEITAYPDSVDYWGKSDIDIIADPYEMKVRVISMMHDAANLTANPIWRLPDTSMFSDEDITNAPGAVQREDLNSLKYGKREGGPEMPNYVMGLVQYLDQKIDELSGLTQITQGKVNPKGQMSTDTVAMMQDAAGVRFRDALRNIESAMTKIGSQYAELVSRFYTEPELVAIKNDVGVTEPIPLLGTHLSVPMKVDAKPGSMINNSPTARLQTMLNLLEAKAGLVDLPEIWKCLAEMGQIDSASALQRRIESEMRNPSSTWLITGYVPPGGAPQQKKGGKKKSNSTRSRKSAASAGAG